MKRFLSILLAMVIVLSLSVGAFAAGSVVAAPTVRTGNKAAALPTTVDLDEDEVTLTPLDKTEDLSEDAQEELKDAKEHVKDAVPDGMVARYLFYSQSMKIPYSLTVKMNDIDDIDELSAKIYVDGKWSELEAVKNDDGTFTITVTANAPVAISTVKQ